MFKADAILAMNYWFIPSHISTKKSTPKSMLTIKELTHLGLMLKIVFNFQY